LLGLLGLLATTTAGAAGATENVWRPGAWLEFLQKTRIGFIWTVRAGLALILFGIILYVRISPGARWHYVPSAAVASLTLTAGSFASHSAAEEQSATAILP
jgi:putative copper resistance protein D